MIGYKAFDKDLKCRGFQFKVGKTYKTGFRKEELKLCSETVFHFCRELHVIDNTSAYEIRNSRVCEVIAVGDIVTDNEKYGTNKIRILREIPEEELISFCNSGKHNSGCYNSGNYNSGDWNSGYCNSGNWNSGNCNSGYFNTDKPPVRIFNSFTTVPLEKIAFPAFLNFSTNVWVTLDKATEREKIIHTEEIKTFGGFLKTLSYKKAFRIAWDCADREDKEKLFKLPNWNNEIFKEISGIDAEKELKENK